MTGFAGADVAQLEVLAGALDRRAESFRSIAADATRSIMVAAWTGADVDRIRGEWNRGAKAALQRVVGELHELAAHVRRQAAEQRAVSAASAGGGQRPAPLADTTADVIHQFSGPEHRDDLFWIEEVVGADGEHRFIVFINGTRGELKDWRQYLQLHGWGWNLPASADVPTIAKLAIENAMASRVTPGAEVMIVGYSQGGMLAQSIADDGVFHVKEVLTIGSPPVLGDHGYGGANVTRLAHGGDEVVNGVAVARNVSAVLAMASAGDQNLVRNAMTPLLTADGSVFNGSGEVHTFRAGTDEPGMVHDVGTGHYDWLAEQYDRSTDPELVAARERQAVFLEGQRV